MFSQVTKNDGFPQYICKNCLTLLENAYQFKTLCEKTDFELKALEKCSETSVKEETIKFLQSEPIISKRIELINVNNLDMDSNELDANDLSELNNDLVDDNDDLNTENLE